MAAPTIPRAYVETFESRAIHISQQEDIRLANWVASRNEQSKSHNWDRIGAVEATTKTVADQGTPVNTPIAEAPWTRRQTQIATYHTGEITYKENVSQMLVDPNSTYVRNLGYAMGRQTDRVIISACDGDSRDGDGNTVPFPAGQMLGSAVTPFSYDLVTDITRLHLENNVPMEMPKVNIISPGVAKKLFQLTEATSRDYHAAQTLATKGWIDSWLGYAWLCSTLLTSPAGTERYCISMTSEAVGLHIARGIETKVGEDPSASFDWRIYTSMDIAAIRVHDEHLIRFHVDEAL